MESLIHREIGGSKDSNSKRIFRANLKKKKFSLKPEFSCFKHSSASDIRSYHPGILGKAISKWREVRYDSNT